MLVKLAGLGERMLSRMVPGITARADSCKRAPEFDHLCNGYQMAYVCIGKTSCYIACHYS